MYQAGSMLSWLGPRSRFGHQRVIRPVMLGIAPLKVLLHLGVGIGTEAGQILSDLNRLVPRREQMQLQGLAAAANAGRGSQPEQLLQAHRQHRRLFLIIDADA